MALDTGAVADGLGLAWASDHDAVPRAPSLEDGEHIGVALSFIRQFNGLSLEDVAERTRIRRHYLKSIEDLNLDQLPSRPFTIGYVRAYAFALGHDGDRAVARFRRDAPDPNEPLRAPVGVTKEADPRLILVVIAGAVVICGIVGWNLTERILSHKVAPPPVVRASARLAPPPPSSGPVALGAPLPAPQESTTPKPYVTPGLEAQMSAAGPSGGGPAASAQDTAAGLDVDQPVGAPFEANGEVFGDADAPGGVILQARQPTSLTVHRADGSIAFARYLAIGQAYHAPVLPGWTAQVSEPAAVNVFVGGALKGPMPSASTQITSLTDAP